MNIRLTKRQKRNNNIKKKKKNFKKNTMDMRIVINDMLNFGNRLYITRLKSKITKKKKIETKLKETT